MRAVDVFHYMKAVSNRVQGQQKANMVMAKGYVLVMLCLLAR